MRANDVLTLAGSNAKLASVVGADRTDAAGRDVALDVPGVSAVRVGLGTTMIEPGLTGGRLDGIGVYTDALLRHLPGAGCDVTGYSYPRLRGGAGAISVGQPMPQSFEAASLRDLLTPRVHRVHMPADIFHVTDYRIVRMDCPLVATLHDALPISHPEWCSPRLRGMKNWLQRKAARKADHVIALSHFAIDELVSCFGIDPQRVSVVPCGVDDEWLEAPDAGAVAATLRAHGLRAGYFLFVGTLQPRKNVERLLEAYLQLPAAVRAERQLVIVGARRLALRGTGAPDRRGAPERRKRRLAERAHRRRRAAPCVRRRRRVRVPLAVRRLRHSAWSRRSPPACRWWRRTPVRCRK